MSTPNLAYIFRGPCGAGKTWLKSKIDRSPMIDVYIDMKDCPRDLSFSGRKTWLENAITFANTPVLVIEGIFAPDTPSWNHLISVLEKRGIEHVDITINASIKYCKKNIDEDENDDDPETRKKFVDIYQPKFV